MFFPRSRRAFRHMNPRRFLSRYCSWKLGKRLVSGSDVEPSGVMQDWEALGFSGSCTGATIPAISGEIRCNLNFIVCLPDAARMWFSPPFFRVYSLRKEA